MMDATFGVIAVGGALHRFADCSTPSDSFRELKPGYCLDVWTSSRIKWPLKGLLVHVP